MGFRRKPFLLPGYLLRAGALAALLIPGAAAWAAGPEAMLVQYYRQDEYRQEQYRQDQYRPDGYGQDPRERRQGRPDGYEGGRRGRDEDERYGRGGGGGSGGTYQRTCDQVRQEGYVLSAVCRDGRGGQVESSLDTRRCGRSDIGNSNGFLQCGNNRANGRRVN